MATLELDASDVNQVVNKLLADRKSLPLMNDLGRIMVADSNLNFRGQKSPDGVPWKPIRRKGQILRDTGHLRSSITYRVDGINKVRIGTNVAYGRAHQHGIKEHQAVAAHTRLITQAFGKKLKYPVYQTVGPHTRFMQLPARPFLGFGPRAVKKIDKAIIRWADDLLD